MKSTIGKIVLVLACVFLFSTCKKEKSSPQPYLRISPTSQFLNAGSGTMTFEISAYYGVNWTATIDQSWCSLGTTSGTGDGNLIIDYSSNSTNAVREATLKVTATDLPEITVTIYQRPLMPSTGLVALYLFNGDANDISTFGNNGTVHNASLCADRFQVDDRAFDFDGINSYISLGANSKINSLTTNFSVSFWAAVTGDGVVFSTYDPSSWKMICRVNTNGSCTFNIYCAGSWQNLSTPSGTFDQNRWHSFIYIREGSNTKMFVNGSLKATGTATGTMSSVNSAVTTIGKNAYGGEHFKGAIDDVCVYNRALSDAEVQQLYYADK